MNYKLPGKILDETGIKKIIDCINTGEAQYKEHFKREKFITNNGKYHEIWNYIYRNVNNSFCDYPYGCYKINRGNLWKFVAIYNKQEKILFVIMKENTFKELQKDLDNEFHYIKILNHYNNYLQKNKYKQISFINDKDKKEEYIQDDLTRMLGAISKEVKVCVDILFSEKDSKVTHISGNVCDYDLRLIKSYCWDEYIKADINEIIDTDEGEIIENPIIELPIKKNAKEKADKKREKTKDEEEILASKKDNDEKREKIKEKIKG